MSDCLENDAALGSICWSNRVDLSEFVSFFGPAGAPAVAAAATYGLFSATDGLASIQAKQAIAARLRTLDFTSFPNLSNFVLHMFERIFGPLQFSVRCIFACLAVSSGSILLVGLVWVLLDYDRAGDWWFSLNDPQDPNISAAIRREYLKWLLASILIDYVLLFKTRLFLKYLTSSRRRLSLSGARFIPLLPIVDVFVGLFLFQLIGNIALASEFGVSATGRIFPAFDLSFFDPIKFDSLPSVLFYTGMVPSIWVWLFLLAALLTGAMTRSSSLVNGLRWFLDIDKAPIKSIGLIAMVVVFLAVSVAAGLIRILA
jgi:hypothetical protein